jgi:antitoxin PrlF
LSNELEQDIQQGERLPPPTASLELMIETHGQCNCITFEIKYSWTDVEVFMVKPLTLQSESTLTDRYQTTVPDTVRKALGLGKRDRIRYTIRPNGEVILSRIDSLEPDPALEPFLNLLAQDIQNNPQRLQHLSTELVNRVQSLTANIEVDLDAPLLDADE